MNTVKLEEMTSPQIAKAIENGYDTAIFTAGAIEQHGKHLPIGMDAIDGYIFSVKIAEKLGNALVAPVIRPGCSDHHMDFAGTITISKELLQQLCFSYCRSLCSHGFTKIALTPSHGGNIEAMEEIVPVINDELPCKVVWANVLRDPRTDNLIEPILEEYGVTEQEGGMHSGFVETSLLLATSYEEYVDMDVAERGFVGESKEEVDKLKKKNDGEWNISDLSPIGVLGDPTKATREAGEKIMSVLVDAYTEIVNEKLTE